MHAKTTFHLINLKNERLITDTQKYTIANEFSVENLNLPGDLRQRFALCLGLKLGLCTFFDILVLWLLSEHWRLHFLCITNVSVI